MRATTAPLALEVTRQDRDRAHQAARVISGQRWRVDHTETGWLTDFETGYWGWLAELAMARHLGVDLPIILDGSHPQADLTAGGLAYEVRSTPWLRRRAWQAGTYRTFVYPREVATPGLVIARVDSFCQGGLVQLTGWLWAAEAAAWPLDAGRHLTRHAVLPAGLHSPGSLPRGSLV